MTKLKEWVRRPRNIRHPNWVDMDHDRAVEAINFYPLGNVLFRPSKRHDIIIAMLKVRATDGTDVDGDSVEPGACFRSFDVLELDNKTVSNGFELALALEVDGWSYKDFNEIIARHMDPIMDNLRLLCEHKRYGLRQGEVTDKYEVKDALSRFSKENRNQLFYCLLKNKAKGFIGHALLIWALGGQKPREEIVEITPQGYSMWGKPFDKVDSMIKWFKLVGWRNATRLRKDFLDTWSRRRKEGETRRGTDAFSDRPKKAATADWRAASTTLGGLQTPAGGGLSTPSGHMAYGYEAAAPTPGGLSTPHGGGCKTPSGAMAPGSPAMPNTFFHSGGTATPSGISPGTPGGFAPGTPGGYAPGTPRQAFGAFGSAAPSTPVGAMRPGAGGYVAAAPAGRPRPLSGMQPATPTTAPVTPSGLAKFTGSVPVTPGSGAAPGTAAFGGGGTMTPMPGRVGTMTPGMAQPMTPMGRLPSTPGGLMPSGTPAGLQPGTPAGLMPGTPAGLMPGTPAGLNPATPVGLKPLQPGTPAGLMPGTPAGLQPGTPAGLMPGTPAGLMPGTPAGLNAPGTPHKAPATPLGLKRFTG